MYDLVVLRIVNKLYNTVYVLIKLSSTAWLEFEDGICRENLSGSAHFAFAQVEAGGWH